MTPSLTDLIEKLDAWAAELNGTPRIDAATPRSARVDLLIQAAQALRRFWVLEADWNAAQATVASESPDLEGLKAKLKSSAAAFREHPIFTVDGDPVLLTVQADELEEASVALQSLQDKVELTIGVLSDLLETGLAHSSKFRKATDVLSDLVGELKGDQANVHP